MKAAQRRYRKSTLRHMGKSILRHMGCLLCIVLFFSAAGRNPALTGYACQGILHQECPVFIAGHHGHAENENADARSFLAANLPFQSDMEVEDAYAQVSLLTLLRTCRLSLSAQLHSQKSTSEKLARQELADRQVHDISHAHSDRPFGKPSCAYYVFTLRRILI